MDPAVASKVLHTEKVGLTDIVGLFRESSDFIALNFFDLRAY